ncbi:Uncharacterized protein dnl_09410 [Desulfonema limicola]|uniref:Uncharacterized protein n=1 Tax=Desulfonema limicola TaxID=45656 RepID=A0A975B4M6_9BACT|nr:hypothetical protein [Desulfonema limicola]QTA78709.1 Uncharacterized protein dnl_09410 [Desulfonema limicola]
MDVKKSQKIKHALKTFETFGISHEPGDGVFEMMLLYKELMENSSLTEIRQFEESLSSSERKLFMYVNMNILSDDTALEVLKNTYIRRCIDQEKARLEQDFQKKQNEFLKKRRNRLNQIRNQIHKERNQRENEIEGLYLTIDRLSQRNQQLKSELSGAMKQARAIMKQGLNMMPLQSC